MLEENLKELLIYINLKSKGGYAVIDVTEFEENYSLNDGVNIENLLNRLKELGYIDLKYFDGERMLVLSTEKGINFECVKKEEKPLIKQNFSTFGWCFFGGFLGGLVGALITCVLILIIGA